MNNNIQQFDNITMNLPMQAPSVDRENRLGASMDAGVEPAFLGGLLAGVVANAVAPFVGSAVNSVVGTISDAFS